MSTTPLVFTEAALSGVWFVDCQTFVDERGTLTPTWLEHEFRARGLDTHIAQTSLATNTRRNTIRGMHYQLPPHAEVKCVRAIRGAIYDVVVDMRPGSPTRFQWVGVELSAATRRMIYIPRGFAHGYQTLTDDAEVLYLVSATYSAAHQRGARWDDPAFGIVWPLGAPAVINARDAAYPDVEREA